VVLFSFVSTVAPETVIHHEVVRPYKILAADPGGDLQFDYLGWYSGFFRACRGGIKYFFYISTSSFTTTRLRISFEPRLQTVTSTVGGETYSIIVDVQGDTLYSLTVPYMYISNYMPMTFPTNSNDLAGTAYGQILFSLVNAVQTTGTTDTVYVNIFRSAAEDFEFAYLKSFNLNPTVVEAPMAIANCDIEKAFEVSFNPFVEGTQTTVQDRITTNDKILTHLDFLHRYTNYTSSAAGVQVNLPLVPHYDTYPAGSAQWLGCFRFWRGSVRFLLMDGSPTSYLWRSETGVSWSSEIPSMRVPTDSTTAVPAVIIPYENTIRFRGIVPTIESAFNIKTMFHTITAEAGNVYWAAGDDFTLGSVRGPPKWLM